MPILDATAGTLVALLGIWAAVGRGHWFLRFMVVAALLLAPLLIPAYELVIQNSLAVVLIVAGIQIYRGYWPQARRFSLATLLLVTGVLAVIGAVLVNAPEFELSQWLGFVGIGSAVASVTLLCLWAVFGERHWWQRTRFFCYGAFFLAVGGHAIYFFTYSFQSNGFNWNYWQQYLPYFYSLEWLIWWFQYYVGGAMIAAVLLICLLLLARRTQWFPGDSTVNETEGRVRRTAARCAFVSLLVAVAALPIYVFYRLLTPEPLPPVVLPDPNGYEGFVTAGNMLTDDIHTTISNLDTLTLDQLESERNKLIEAIEQTDIGLKKNSKSPFPYPPYGDDYESAEAALYRIWSALILELTYWEKKGQMAEFTRSCLRLIRFEVELQHGQGTESVIPGSGIGRLYLRKNFGKFSPTDCRSVVQELLEIEDDREPRSVRVAQQRIIDRHQDWSSHFQQIVSDLAGVDHYAPDYWELHGLADSRLFIVELALHAYFGDAGELPASLQELVPKYLAYIPNDPFGVGPIKYLVEKDRYKLYSCGWDRDDDGGVSEDLRATDGGDQVVTGPMTSN